MSEPESDSEFIARVDGYDDHNLSLDRACDLLTDAVERLRVHVEASAARNQQGWDRALQDAVAVGMEADEARAFADVAIAAGRMIRLQALPNPGGWDPAEVAGIHRLQDALFARPALRRYHELLDER